MKLNWSRGLSLLALLSVSWISAADPAPPVDPFLVELNCLVSSWSLPLLDNSATEYSPKNSAALALLAAATYQPPEVVTPLANKLGFNKVVYFSHKENDLTLGTAFQIFMKGLTPHQRLVVSDTSGYWFESDDSIVLSITGTDPQNILNLYTDGYDNLIPMANFGSVHSGFYGAIDIVWREVYGEYLKVGKPKPIWITGHSLGGAVATLAAVHLLNEEKREIERRSKMDGADFTANWERPYVAGLYTYGSPEVGDVKFQTTFNQLFFHPRLIMIPSKGDRVLAPPAVSARIINQQDLIPTVPGNGQFRHVWNPYQIQADGSLKSLGGYPAGASLTVDEPQVGPIYKLLENAEAGLRYHKIFNYLSELLALANPGTPNACLGIDN